MCLVSEFAKKTGDYRSLSMVDLRLLALVYRLEKENVGTDHLRTQPIQTVNIHTRLLCFLGDMIIYICFPLVQFQNRILYLMQN